MILGGDILQQVWCWYWDSKAQVSPCGVPVVDEIVLVWNWVMANDLVRGLALASVVVWVVACAIDAAVAGGRKPPQVTEKPQTASEPVSQASPQEVTGGELMRELERLGKTQTELAEALGVTRGYISKLIKGTKPFTPELQVQCRAILNQWDVDRSKGRPGG